MTEALDRSEKGVYHTVAFTFGDPQKVRRYTNAGTDNPFGGNEISVPAMTFELPANNGTLLKAEATIVMEVNDQTREFLEPLTRGTPFARVKVRIEERVDPSVVSDAATNLIPFRGTITRTLANFNGRNNRVKIFVGSVKDQFSVPMGFPCSHHCPWRLNGPGCREITHGPQSYVQRVSDIIGIDGQIVTFDALTVPIGSRSWARGFLTFDGLNIGVKEWDPAAPNELVLVEQPPEEWLGASVTATPGCPKLVDHPNGCRDAWNNEQGFGGSGFAMPAYNPIIETE